MTLAAPPAGPRGDRMGDSFIDRFLPRMAANLVAMAGVALATLWLVEQRQDDTGARIDALEHELDELRHERDRMSRLNQELAREVHDSGVASEIARWQLRWTEERLRRTELQLAARSRPSRAGSPGSLAAPDAVVASSNFSLPIGGGDLPPAPRVQALDGSAQDELDQQVARIALGDPGPTADLQGSGAEDDLALTDSRGRSGRGIVPGNLDPLIDELRPPQSQLKRNQAWLEWKRVIGEAIDGECRGRLSENMAHRCEDDVARAAFPYGEQAVRCLMTGNAEPDYVAVADINRLPTHSVPLGRGAIILCDGALPNN